MVYAGTKYNKRYNSKVPNDKIARFFYTTSKDGLSWKKKGLAINSMNSRLEGWVDVAELVNFDGQTRLYFWGYKGVYCSKYSKGHFSKPILTFTNETDKTRVYPAHGPSDPTLMKIKGKWFMYFGQHKKGIYYTTYQ